MAFTLLNKPLESLIKQEHWTHYHRYLEVCNIWKNVVTNNTLTNTSILSINQNIVYITTSSSGWSQELSFQKYSLLKKINQQLSDNPIDKLHFSSAKWSGKKISCSNLSEQKKKCFFSHNDSYEFDKKIITEKNQTPQEAFTGWTKVIKKRLKSFSVCPQCKRPASLHELERWSKCYLCIR